MNKKAKDNVDKIGRTGKKIKTIMPLTSDYSSRAEWETVCWWKIITSKELLQLLITSHERHDLVMRAVALDRLIAGKSYKQISEELWLSPQTISVLKKALKEDNYRSYLERSKKERKKKQYSSWPVSFKPRRSGTPRRTKYGTVYLPY